MACCIVTSNRLLKFFLYSVYGSVHMQQLLFSLAQATSGIGLFFPVVFFIPSIALLKVALPPYEIMSE